MNYQTHQQSSEGIVWVLVLCVIAIGLFYSWDWPVIALIWLAAANLPPWFTQTDQNKAVRSAEDRERYIASIIITKVNMTLPRIKEEMIDGVYYYSYYDQAMRDRTLNADWLSRQYIVDDRDQYYQFTEKERRQLNIGQGDINTSVAQAKKAIKQSVRFKVTTGTFLAINLFFFFSMLTELMDHPSMYSSAEWMFNLIIYTFGAFVFGMYIIPICTVKRHFFEQHYSPSEADIKIMLDHILKNSTKLTQAEKVLSRQIRQAEDQLFYEMREIIEGKMNYFENYDLYYRVTHNDKIDYHYLIKPYAKENRSKAQDDTIVFSSYYLQHSPYDPVRANRQRRTSFHSILEIYSVQHPELTFSQEEMNQINGEGFEYSTLIQFALNGSHYFDRDFLESGLLIPKPGHDDGLQTGQAYEYDIIYICKKGNFVIECKNWTGALKGRIYAEKGTYSRHLEYCPPNGDSFKAEKYNPIIQNKSHIKTLRERIAADVYGGKDSELPFYNVIVTSDRLDISKLNRRRKNTQPDDLMYWVRYGKIEDFFKLEIANLEDSLSDAEGARIDQYLSKWRYPTKTQLRVHNENNKRVSGELNDSFFV